MNPVAKIENGKPPARPVSLMDRLLRNSELDPITGCWNWTGYCLVTNLPAPSLRTKPARSKAS